MVFQSCKCLVLLVLVANSVFSLQPSYSCHDHERTALLQFKHSFAVNCAPSLFAGDAYPKMESWGVDSHLQAKDCCLWDGVSCNNKTGHVIGLDLGSSCLYGTFPSNSSLFQLTHLRHLILYDNHFNRSQIPSEIGQLSKLVSLDLSDSAFSGQIPLAISSLSQLSLLDLSSLHGPKADSQLRLEDPSLEKLVQNLTRLTDLYLRFVDLSSSSVPVILANLTSLKAVSLEFCKLNGEFPTDIFHLPHLELLSLIANEEIEGSLPEFQPNSPLNALALSMTSFHGELPSSIGQLANLEQLLLGNNGLSGPIPSSLGNLTKLTGLDLSYTALSGDLPSSLTNLTQLDRLGLSHLNGTPERLISWLSNLNQINTLALNFMNFGSEIPSVITNRTSLCWLDLSNNQLTGGIPDRLMNLTGLGGLILSRNQLEGPISSPGISQLANLNILFLRGNHNLHGNFDTLLKLEYLKDLDLSGATKLTFLHKDVANRSVAKLNYLQLQSCNLTEFPQFLHGQDELQVLNLSSNNIQGSIPEWFLNVSQESLHTLDLSSNFLTGFEHHVKVLPWSRLEMLYLQGNQLQGSLPIPPSSVVVYQVSQNQLTGSIPHQICQASSMNYLDVSNNNLSGQVPNCVSELSSSLIVLNLKGNKFHGDIPRTYPRSCRLKMINLSDNQLEGSMPRSLANCINLEVLDIGRNHVNDTFPSWLGGLPRLHILVLRYNNFHGRIGKPKVGHEFRSLRIIDLSNNFHTGDLPLAYLESWDAMKVTNQSLAIASGTRFEFYIGTPNLASVGSYTYDYSITITNKGNDMQYTKVLTVFRVIDFSRNNFTGKIPHSIGELRGLQAINLSNNNLAGGIPSSLANIRDLESLDLSNNILSGQIPSEITQLSFLAVFNVSHNHLTGPIPQGSQLSARDNSSFVGNLGLCGAPLSKKCGDEDGLPSPPDAMESDDNEEDSKLIDWIIRCLGCVSGFAVGCAFGKYLTDRNHEWFVESFGTRRRPRTRRRQTARPMR